MRLMLPARNRLPCDIGSCRKDAQIVLNAGCFSDMRLCKSHMRYVAEALAKALGYNLVKQESEDASNRD